MIKDCSDAARFARAHGISEEVWNARPYRRWTPKDMSALDESFGAGFSLRSKLSKVVDGEDGHNGSGWLINRYPVDASDLPHVFPEMRPDNAVELRPARSHFHGEIEDFPFEIIEIKPSSMAGGPKWIHYRCAEGSDRASRWVPAYRPTSFAMVGSAEIPDGHINRAKDKGQDNHAGVNSLKIHAHTESAKYLFNPSPKVERQWEHAHDEQDSHYVAKPEALAGHMAKRHDGEGPVAGPHAHSDRVKDPDRNYAARIDVHPMAAKRLSEAELIFFGLEGCIKADALLTAIISEGCNASVISVPSVSLWDCPELALTVSRFLLGKTVVIVVDADGVDNPRVSNQAAMCQSMLLKLGVREVLVTAPALDIDSKIIVDPVIGKLKGVDDFLAAGYKLSDLAVATSVAPVSELLALAENISPPREDSQQRLFDLLFSFSTFAGESGQLRAPMVTVAKVLGVSHQTVGRDVQRLVDAEIVSVWADPAMLCAGKLAARQDWRKRWDWQERPFLVLCKRYRATMVRQSLGYVA